MEWLYPRIGRREWGLLFLLAVQGALVAGGYGILHDQLTYSISPEYYTCFKFGQFHYADFGWPVRWHVATIGFLATWWVGFFAGWLLARSAVRRFSREQVASRVRRAFAFVLLSALLGGGIAGVLPQAGSCTPPRNRRDTSAAPPTSATPRAKMSEKLNALFPCDHDAP